MTDTQGYIDALEARLAAAEAVVAAVTAKRDRLIGAILDIDAHAKQYGDGEWIEWYRISVGSLHRALGLIGHPAPPCEDKSKYPCKRAETAEARLAAAEAVVEAARELYEPQERYAGLCTADALPGAMKHKLRAALAAYDKAKTQVFQA